MKYLGLLLLVLGSFAAGRVYSLRLLKKPRLLSELAELVERLAEGARCYHRPYSITLAELSMGEGDIPSLALTLAHSDSLARGYSAWEGRREIGEDGDALLSSLFSKLGGAELSREVELLASARDRLAALAGEAEKKARTDGKAAVLTAVAAGLGLALLLL